jgi:hypothetical protein
MIKRLIRILYVKLYRSMVIYFHYSQEYCPIVLEYLNKSFKIWESHYKTDYIYFCEDIKTNTCTSPNRIYYIKLTIEEIKCLIDENKHRVRMLHWAYKHGYHKRKDIINGKDVYDKMVKMEKFYNKIKDFNPDLVIKKIKMKEKLKRLKADF